MAVIGTPVVTDERSFYVKCFGMDTSSNINTRYRLYVQDKTKLDSNSYIDRVNLKADEYGGTDSTFYVTLPNTYTVEDVGKLRLYDSISDSEEDVRYVTLTYVKAPSIPTNIYYPVSINSYNAVSISWSSVSGATSYVLERALHGSSSFTQVYSGSGTSYSDRIPSGATKAQYRVKAVNSGGSSGYKTGNLANVYYTKPNVAPTTPSSISVPSTVYGGKAFTVSWGKSTDSDGNLSGYKLEQSYNSGSTWTQVYQGSATSTSITIPFGATTRVLYRVKAYDSDGAESGYKVSSKSDVIFFILCMKNRLYF